MPRKKDLIVKTFTFEGRRYSVSGKDEADAIANLKIKKNELEKGSLIYESNMTLRQWAKIAIDTYKVGVTDKYLYTYKNRVKNAVLDYMGDIPLKSIRNIHCQNCLNAQAGNSAYQIKQTKQILNFLLKSAVENGLITKNHAESLSLPQGKVTSRRSLTDFERSHFLKCATANPNYHVFLVTYYCGCRPSEAMELKYSDISVIDGVPLLHIRGTKSSAADRYVPIPDDLYKLLKKDAKTGYLFSTSTGKKIPEKNYRDRWQSLINAMNISAGCKTYRNRVIPPYIFETGIVPYYLRHTFCTELRDKGVDIRDAQYLMGHSDIKLTANIYTHSGIGSVLAIADKINIPVVPAVVPNPESVDK